MVTIDKFWGYKCRALRVLVCSFAVPGTRMQRCFYKARVSTLNKWLKWRASSSDKCLTKIIDELAV